MVGKGESEMKKMKFDEVYERLCNDQKVDRNRVRQRDLQRVLWIAAWGFPGCLYETQVPCLTRDQAIAEALQMANNPEGMKEELESCGRSSIVSPEAYVKSAETVIYSMTVDNLI
jgi:hypothetical protein